MSRGIFAAAASAASLLLVAAPPASAWTRSVDLGAARIAGDSSHRLMGRVTWQMPVSWTSTITEGDSGSFRFWPSTIQPGCLALASYSFRPVHTTQSQAKRLAAIRKPFRGGRLLASGIRAGGVWSVIRNSVMATGLPSFPGAYYVDGAGLIRVGSTTWLDLDFYAYTSGSCTVGMVDASGLIDAATAFVRDADHSLRVAGKWPSRP